MRNRAGITGQSPTGTDEVIFSNVTKTESGRGCGLGEREERTWNMVGSSPGTEREKWDSPEHFVLIRLKKPWNLERCDIRFTVMQFPFGF
jgi:hypothetical protein